MLHDPEDSLDRSKLIGSTGSTAAGRPTAVAPALPGRTVTGCVILRNSHVIRVAARRVRVIRGIPVKSWLTTAHARSEEDMMAARLPYLAPSQAPPTAQPSSAQITKP